MLFIGQQRPLAPSRKIARRQTPARPSQFPPREPQPHRALIMIIACLLGDAIMQGWVVASTEPQQ